jgi:hypothetical protein
VKESPIFPEVEAPKAWRPPALTFLTISVVYGLGMFWVGLSVDILG